MEISGDLLILKIFFIFAGNEKHLQTPNNKKYTILFVSIIIITLHMYLNYLTLLLWYNY